MRDETRQKIVDVTTRAGERILAPIERWIGRSSLVGDRTFWEVEEFPWARTVEAEWHLIRTELEAVLQDHDALPNFQEISTDQVALTNDDQWKAFFIYGFGFKAEANAERCPETTRIVEAIPGMKTAFFSILSPHKHIPAHRGPYKGVMRYHLGLRIPDPREGCRIRVGEDIRHWDDGQSLIFDDTYDHEAWNDTDGVRVVLFVDFVRPLRQPAKAFNSAVLKAIAWSPFVQDAKQRQAAWEQRFGRLKTKQPAAAA